MEILIESEGCFRDTFSTGNLIFFFLIKTLEMEILIESEGSFLYTLSTGSYDTDRLVSSSGVLWVFEMPYWSHEWWLYSIL